MVFPDTIATAAPLFEPARHAPLAKLADDYRAAEIFPHIVIDNFLDSAQLAAALADFPAISSEGWTHYQHFNESKGGLNKRALIPQRLLEIIDTLNGPDFTNWLSRITGIADLRPDPDLEGGGLHQIKPGGFLNIHADFTVHPHRRMWRRRVNVLLYFNQDWLPAYGGALEFWTKDMARPFRKIAPLFNRCVIFNTDADSYHGHPQPLACPEGMTRKSIALYYFTEEKRPPRKLATNYRARPGDGMQALFIYLDKQLLAFYHMLKGWFGLNDDFASRILRLLAKLKGK